MGLAILPMMTTLLSAPSIEAATGGVSQPFAQQITTVDIGAVAQNIRNIFAGAERWTQPLSQGVAHATPKPADELPPPDDQSSSPRAKSISRIHYIMGGVGLLFIALLRLMSKIAERNFRELDDHLSGR